MRDTNIEDIRQQLATMIAEARQRRLWLYCSYQALWFSPDELARENAEGKFLWGPVNWKMRHPNEGLRLLLDEHHQKGKEIEAFSKRMLKWPNSL